MRRIRGYGWGVLLLSSWIWADPTQSLSITYTGDTYQRVVLKDAKGNTLFDRKLVPGQGMSVPVQARKKKQTFFVEVNNLQLTVRTGCKAKQLNKALAADLVRFSYQQVATPCVYKVKALPKPKAEETAPTRRVSPPLDTAF